MEKNTYDKMRDNAEKIGQTIEKSMKEYIGEIEILKDGYDRLIQENLKLKEENQELKEWKADARTLLHAQARENFMKAFESWIEDTGDDEEEI